MLDDSGEPDKEQLRSAIKVQLALNDFLLGQLLYLYPAEKSLIILKNHSRAH